MKKIVNRDELPNDPEKSMSPVDRVISELDGNYYKLSETAKIVGVAESTLRRLLRREVLPIPSKVLMMGEGWAYLFTEEDIDLIKQYYQDKSFGSTKGE